MEEFNYEPDFLESTKEQPDRVSPLQMHVEDAMNAISATAAKNGGNFEAKPVRISIGRQIGVIRESGEVNERQLELIRSRIEERVAHLSSNPLEEAA